MFGGPAFPIYTEHDDFLKRHLLTRRPMVRSRRGVTRSGRSYGKGRWMRPKFRPPTKRFGYKRFISPGKGWVRAGVVARLPSRMQKRRKPNPLHGRVWRAARPCQPKQMIARMMVRREFNLVARGVDASGNNDNDGVSHIRFNPICPANPEKDITFGYTEGEGAPIVTTVSPDGNRQPYGWDDCTSRYGTYVVTHCDIKVERVRRMDDHDQRPGLAWGIKLMDQKALNLAMKIPDTGTTPAQKLCALELWERKLFPQGTPIACTYNVNSRGPIETKRLSFNTRKWYGPTIDGLRDLETLSSTNKCPGVEQIAATDSAALLRRPSIVVYLLRRNLIDGSLDVILKHPPPSQSEMTFIATIVWTVKFTNPVAAVDTADTVDDL